MKSLALRLDDGLHARMSCVAKLAGMTITDAIREACEQWITVEGPKHANDVAAVVKQIQDRATSEVEVLKHLIPK